MHDESAAIPVTHSTDSRRHPLSATALLSPGSCGEWSTAAQSLSVELFGGFPVGMPRAKAFVWTPIDAWLTNSMMVPLRVVVFHALLAVIDIVLRSVGQVYVVNHPIGGVLMLVGVWLTDGCLVGSCLLGAFAANCGAVWTQRYVLGNELLRDGVYGYDGVLVAAALGTFVDNACVTAQGVLFCFCVCFFAGCARTSLGRLLSFLAMPTLTIVFCSITITTLHILSLVQPVMSLSVLSTLTNTTSTTPRHAPDVSFVFFLDAIFNGIGQVIFATTPVGGALVTAGILIYSRSAACFGVVGSVIGTGLGLTLLERSTDRGTLDEGLFSYNGALIGIVLGIHAIVPIRSVLDCTIPLVGSVGASFMQVAWRSLIPKHLPMCTLAFVTTTWIMTGVAFDPSRGRPANPQSDSRDEELADEGRFENDS